MLLTQLGMLDGTPLDFHSDKLDDFSPAASEADARFGDEQLKILRSYGRSHMTREQLLSYQVLEWFLADQAGGRRFMYHDYSGQPAVRRPERAARLRSSTPIRSSAPGTPRTT
jgi:uncharacterized protein (DUF885 family)